MGKTVKRKGRPTKDQIQQFRRKLKIGEERSNGERPPFNNKRGDDKR